MNQSSSLLAGNLRCPAAARGEVDGDFAVGRNGGGGVNVVTGCLFGVRAVLEDVESPVAFAEETQIEGKSTLVPVREGTDIPGVTAAAGNGDVLADFPVPSASAM